MYSNCNNMTSYNNPNLSCGTVGMNIENGNNTVLGTNTCSYNTDALGANINQGYFNNNSCSNDVLGINNLSSYNCNGNNSINNNTCACNCNDSNNSCGCNCNGCSDNNNSCNCNCNGNSNNNNTDNDNATRDSLQKNLRNFIGRRVTVELNNCGTCNKKTGVLTCVGNNFITLRGINNNNCLLIDTAGLIFITVHNCG